MAVNNGGWVFISHSHQDIDKVRKVRNYLERLGFEPLMFYLKCLSDEDEIEELIKREIDEREWFIYADSPMARSSKWVRAELDYMQLRKKEKVFTIHLEEDLESQFREIDRIARQMKVFIVASRRDRYLSDKIRKKLMAQEMLVLSDEEMAAGELFMDSATAMIEDASRNGFVLLLITEGSANSEFIRREVHKALAAKAKLVPVYVGGAKLDPALLFEIGTIQGVTLSCEPSDEELDRVVEHILHRVEYYANDFTNSAGYRAARSISLPPISVIDNMTFWDCDNLECVYIPESVVYIAGDAFEDHPDILVKCCPGSYAHEYCVKNNIRFQLVE